MADIRELMKRMGGKGKQKKKKDSNTTASLPDLEASAGPSTRTDEHDSPDTTPAVEQPTNSTVPSIEELIRTKADWQKPEKDGANLS